jgi:hypothetical protein
VLHVVGQKPAQWICCSQCIVPCIKPMRSDQLIGVAALG